jgi:hypothetical protein
MPPGKRNARKLHEENALKNTKEKMIQRGLKEINKLAKKGSTHFCLYHQDLFNRNFILFFIFYISKKTLLIKAQGAPKYT